MLVWNMLAIVPLSPAVLPQHKLCAKVIMIWRDFISAMSQGG